jgi:hypothetical protein
VKLSSFLEAVSSGQVDEVLIEGQSIYFSSHSSDWY